MTSAFSPARLLAPLLALGLLAGCQAENGTALDFRHNREGTGTPVAKFNGDSVTVEQVQQRAAELSPFQRPRLQTQEGKKEMVEGFVRFELVVNEALKRGLQNDPAVIAAAKRVMVERLLQQEIDSIGAPISDQQISERYEQHKSDFVKPEMVRLSHLFLAAPRPEAAKVAETRQKAEELLTRVRGLPPLDFKAFGELARAHSQEKRTQPLDGDMRYLSQEELARQYGAEVADAANKLGSVGEVSGLVQTESGFHILKLQGRQAALNLSREMVKTQLIKEIAAERRGEAYAKLMERLEKESGFTLDEAALAKITVDMSAPAKQSEGPGAGYLPPPNRGASLMNTIPAPPPGARPNFPGTVKQPPLPTPVLGGPSANEVK